MIPQLNSQMIGEDIESGPPLSDRRSLINDATKSVNIERVAGVIDSEDLVRFKRLVFRSTKGKSFVYAEQIFDDEDPENIKKKSVYIVTFQDGFHIREKI